MSDASAPGCPGVPGCQVSKPGDPIRIGDILGHGMESNLIVGRVTGFLKQPGHSIIFRTYRNQTELWPTGGYRTAGMVFPHYHYKDGHCERFIHTEDNDE